VYLLRSKSTNITRNIKENRTKELVAFCFCLFAFAEANSQQPTVLAVETAQAAITLQVTPIETIKLYFKHFNALETGALRGIMSYKLTIHSLIISSSEGKNMITTSAASELHMLANIPADRKFSSV
jgi:hypothetical protein